MLEEFLDTNATLFADDYLVIKIDTETMERGDEIGKMTNRYTGYREITERTARVNAPVRVRGNLVLAEHIAFGAE